MSTPSLIQVANTSGVFASDVTEGDLLLMFTNIAPGAYPASGLCTDTQGNKYQLLSFYIGWALEDLYTLAVWYAIAKTTGANTITVRDSAGILTAAEYSASSIDVASLGTPTPDNPALSADLTTSFNDELLVGFAAASESDAITGASSPFNLDYLESPGKNYALESQVVSSTGTYQSSFATARAAQVLTGLIGLSTEAFPVISGNCGTAGATVCLTGALQAQVTADGSGNYSFANVINGDYTVTPYSNGIAFSPNNASVTVSDSDSETGVDFSNAGAIPKLLQSASGYAGQNLSIEYTNHVVEGDFLLVLAQDYGSAGATISDSQGNEWTLLVSGDTGSPLSAGGKPVMAYVWYATASASGANTVTVKDAIGVLNAVVLEYTPATVDTYSASVNGTALSIQSNEITTVSSLDLIIAWGILNGNGGIAAVNLPFITGPAFSGSLGFLASSSASTNFQSAFTNNAEFVYVGPELSSWATGIFALTSAAFSISGNAGVAGALVTYTGASSGNVTADGSGDFTIPGLLNGVYVITPSLADYVFSPTSQTETVSGENITGVDFTASEEVTYSVSGSTGIPGATVNYSGTESGSTVADANGNYLIQSLTNGSYTITPSAPGFYFTPFFQDVTIDDASLVNINFVAKSTLTRIPLPFTVRTTAAVTVFACLQQIQVAMTLLPVASPTIAMLNVCAGQLFAQYQILRRQDVTSQTAVLVASIAAAQVAIISLNQIVQDMNEPTPPPDNVETLSNLQATIANAVQTIAHCAVDSLFLR